MQTLETKTKISLTKIKAAIQTANQKFPNSNDWQSELVEITLIPEVYTTLQKLNHAFKLQAVKSQWGNGYVLEHWNSIREDYNSTWPSMVFNGVRRTCYGSNDIEDLRMLSYGHGNKAALKYFEVMP